MAMRGAGGRYHDEAEEGRGGVSARPPPGLSGIELLCFAVAVGVLFWLVPQLAGIMSARGPFVREWNLVSVRPGSLFSMMALTLAASMGLLAAVDSAQAPLPARTRLAGAMLATLVGAVVFHLGLVLRFGLPSTALGLALASGAALRSRCGLGPERAFGTGLALALIVSIAHRLLELHGS